MLTRRHHVDQHDLQGNILCAYGWDFQYGYHLLARIDDPAHGRRAMLQLADAVTTATPWRLVQQPKPLHTLNVAISYPGLRALGVPAPIRDGFASEFAQGMHNRAERLGDTGRSSLDAWDDELKQTDDHHLLLTLLSQDDELLEHERARLTMRLAAQGVDVVFDQLVHMLPGPPGVTDDDDSPVPGREHFGFADGFSQPAIRGNAGPKDKKGMGTRRSFRRWSYLAPGEFVLGYEGEDRLLPAAPPAPLGRSGSYVVFRKLYQDVLAFDRFIEAHLDLEPNEHDPWSLNRDPPIRREEIAARIVGRWTDGRSLVHSRTPTSQAERPEGYLDRINDFDYAHDDPDGFACPLGAHVRRANPRDGLGWQGRLAKRHRIIRRSMPYGDAPRGRQAFSRPPDDKSAYESERGLVFVCYQASIARQFEVIQQRWLNDGDAFWLGEEKDFLAAGGDPGPETWSLTSPSGEPGHMTIQGTPPRYLTPQPYFVELRGGGYFFAPGIAAMRALGSAYWN